MYILHGRNVALKKLYKIEFAVYGKTKYSVDYGLKKVTN